MIRACSSLTMTYLIEWRNRELRHKYKNHLTILKKIIAEPCFLGISIVAIIESIAATILLVATIPLYFITIKKPYILACKWLKSASFTYSWGLVLLIYNFSKSTLTSTEANAFNY